MEGNQRIAMKQPDTLKDKILLLEEKLLTPVSRKSAEVLGGLLSDDFIEFGSSGEVYNKQQIITALQSESGRAIALSDFQIRPLAPDIVLATYRTTSRLSSDSPPKRALRSSIWRFEVDGWRMIFHQGTPIK
jgi:hypothetical protein